MAELLVHAPEEEVRELLQKHHFLSSFQIKTDNGPSNLLLQGSPSSIQLASSLFLRHSIPTFPVTSSSPPPFRLGLVGLGLVGMLGLGLTMKWEMVVEWEVLERWAGEGVWYLLLAWILLVILAFLKLFSYSLPYFAREGKKEE